MMLSRVLFVVVAASAIGGESDVAADVSVIDERDATEDIVHRVLARRDALFNGIIEYRRATGFRSASEGRLETHHRVAISGTTWIRRYVGAENVSVNSEGKFMTLAPFEVKPGTSGHTLQIEKPKPLDEIEAPSPSPFLLGTLWENATVAYLKQNAPKAANRGHERIGETDVIVLEWPVEKSERYSAFGKCNNLLNNGGVLRLCVSEAYGYALPRIELIGMDGKVARRIESSEFHEDAPGLYFPRVSSSQWFDDSGPAYYCDFEVVDVERVNKPIAEEEFEVDIPKGTYVVDSRGPKGSINFQMRDETKADPAENVPIVAPVPPSGWSTRKIVLVTFNSMLLCAVICLLGIRYWRRHL